MCTKNAKRKVVKLHTLKNEKKENSASLFNAMLFFFKTTYFAILHLTRQEISLLKKVNLKDH